MSSDITVFVVDDDAAARSSVMALVEAHGWRAEAFESAEALLQTYDGRPGCVISDLRMPGMGGLELQQQLVERRSPLPVIIISAFADVPLAVQAMQSGVLTLLEKPYDEQELLEAIPKALQLSQAQCKQQRRAAELQQSMSQLTSGEREVLALLIEGNTNKAIASRLDLGLRTVEKYRHNLLKKLRVNSLPELVRRVIEWEELAPAVETLAATSKSA